MNKIERFYTFLRKEKIRNFSAFLFYVLFIVNMSEISLPLVIEIITSIILIITMLLGSTYIFEWLDEIFEKIIQKPKRNIAQNFKKISKEIIMFVPVIIISVIITSFFAVGQPENQTSIEESFKESPIFNSIIIIIIGPIIEEFVFRFLPYKFIKNKTLYIIISAIIFGAIHVIDDPNPFYYIWFYMPRPLYYAYRYHKTNNIYVTISLHSFNNLLAILLLIFS